MEQFRRGRLVLQNYAFFLLLLALCGTSAYCQRSCRAGQLTLSAGDGLIAGGGRVLTNFVVTNSGPTACTLMGYPNARALDEHGKPVPQISFVRMAEFGAGGPENAKLRKIRLLPKSNAWFQVTSSDAMGMEDTSLCPLAHKLEVTMPGNLHPLKTTPHFAACDAPAGISFIMSGLPN